MIFNIFLVYRNVHCKHVLANIMFGLTLNWMQMFVDYCVFLSCILNNANQTKSYTAPSATIILLPKGFICMCTIINLYYKISIAKYPHTMLYWFVPLPDKCVFNSFLTHCTKYRSQISYTLKIPVAVYQILLASIVFYQLHFSLLPSNIVVFNFQMGLFFFFLLKYSTFL